MRRVGQTRRRDANEKAIVAALRAHGADVFRISGRGCPDLLVRFRGHLWAFEVKGAKGTRTSAQEASGFPIVRTPHEALRVLENVEAVRQWAVREWVADG